MVTSQMVQEQGQTAQIPAAASSANSMSSATSQTDTAPAEKVLCPHCLRTATNGIKCQGICVADSNY
ncbi:hypothetical protein [Alkalinema sp. FACHB-956]|uniref:hypothetical protein n=1 Tax=Alkalinema sp. FACHB-956 TaxID=2692768 RepID=UPI00168246C6|nr:hypothetical protein [Alkalinema sp. FACHB-956]MBD2325796.1 hypothetical protein [Alkalinema sp. FACHB-956]